MLDLTKEEEKVIRALERLAKIWPDSLWLFSAAGTLCVMKKNKDGETAFVGTGVDQEYLVASIDIENSGGDW